MTDETGTEIHSPDVVNVEEFPFGHAKDDTPAEVAEGVSAGDAADEAGDTATAEKPDTGTETAAEQPDVADDGGEPPAPGETEELKVVLSIRAGRATIGVQRPSADPHIESFDDPDLFGLADQFPAVVARAIWEEMPQHPAHVKPTPPPRQRNRRQQGAAQAVTTDGEGEAAPPQPETLQLF